MRSIGGALIVVALSVSGCGTEAGPAATPAAPLPTRLPAPALSFEQLDRLLNTVGEPHAEGGDAVDRYRRTIRDRLSRNAFYETFAPKLLSILDVHTRLVVGGTLRDDVVARTLPYGLKYYYNARLGDCGGTDLIDVRPWWNLREPIRICRDSVRADVVRQRQGPYCETSQLTPDDGCGCGPYLLMCTPAPEWRKEFAQQLAAEVVQTLKYIVENRERYSSLVTMDSTVRSTFADLWYARSGFFQGDPFEFPPLDQKARSDFSLRPRRPEHRGGILTTPYVLYADQARRVISQTLWNDLLCVDWKAVGVDAHKLMEVTENAPDLRGTVNTKLASTPGCRGCHVRLEYPSLALEGFVNGYQGSRYVGRKQPATVEFYVHGYEDHRGSLPADPGALGEMITKQPEFLRCAVRRVTEFAYQGYPVATSVEERLLADFEQDEDLARLIEDSLIARIFGERALQ